MRLQAAVAAAVNKATITTTSSNTTSSAEAGHLSEAVAAAVKGSSRGRRG
jgi:hypothetical protein